MAGSKGRQQPQQAEQHFRFMELPAEIRVLIYEQVALETIVFFPIPGLDDLPCCLLGVSKQIKQEALPVVCALTTISTKIKEWDFGPLEEMIIEFKRIGMLPYLRINPHLVISITPTVWEEDDKQRIQEWLESCVQAFGPRWTYAFAQRNRARRKWKSRAGFLWRAGLSELKTFRTKLSITAGRTEIDKITAAMEEEGERIDNVMLRAEFGEHPTSWRERKRLGESDRRLRQLASMSVESGNLASRNLASKSFASKKPVKKYRKGKKHR